MNAAPSLKPRWFQFNLRLLLVLPLVFAAVWWWVTWPQRTAEDFVQLLATGDVRGAKAMISDQQPTDVFWTIVEANALKFDGRALKARQSYDYFAAHEQFEVICRWKTGQATLGEFIARRRRVEAVPTRTGKHCFLYEPRNTSAQHVQDFVGHLKSLYAGDENVEFRDFGTGVWVVAPYNVHQEIKALAAITKTPLAQLQVRGGGGAHIR